MVGVGDNDDPDGRFVKDRFGPNQRNSSTMSASVTTMPKRLKRISSALHFTLSRSARQSVRGYQSLTSRSQDGNAVFSVFDFLRHEK